jgi:peptide/nickel transport system substrate-binding protein
MDTTQITEDFTRGIKQSPSFMKELYRSLSPERVILIWVLLFVSVILLFSALVSFNSRFLTTVPSYGGKISEGIVGTPRFINPILATSEQDEDLTSLVYAGLTKKDKYGNTVYDMAESVTESDDELHYDVTLRKDATFHDGAAVTVDDVIYTVNLAQNPNIKSPHRLEWEGITMEKVSDYEVIFTLKQKYPLFMDNLTLGILPKHVWKNLTDEQFSLSDYNIHAIGSGPYKIDAIRTSSGIPYEFDLVAHKNYTLGRPYVDSLVITTYQNEKYAVQAFDNGDISRIHGITPDSVSALGVNASQVHTSLLPRTFTIFFNPNKNTALSERVVRQALLEAIDKQAIVTTVLHDYGKVVDSPYPFDEETASSTYNPEGAKALLATSKEGKANQKIEITLATANTDEMRKVADMVKTYWEAVGVTVNLAVYEVSDLNQSVIKERDFQALLFGSIVNTPSDLYPFWHSSQRNYPGLNISNYVSNTLDKNLDILRKESDPEARADAYEEVKQEFKEEVPGIFLFAPSLIYVAKDKAVTVLPFVSYTNSSRFTLVNEWHMYSERIWPKTYFKSIVEAVENIIH